MTVDHCLALSNISKATLEAAIPWAHSTQSMSATRLQHTDFEWQTKSLDRCLFSYFLRHDDNGAITLYLLDSPSDRRFWRAWTEQEIAASERLAQNERNRLFRQEKKLGEGCFLPEAYLPQHRRQRFMGELPHQWVEIHGTCACKEYVQY